MSYNIPTTQQLIDRAVATFENKLAQTISLFDKAFLRVLSVLLGVSETELYKYAVERAKQNLALTATEEDLAYIGRNYNVFQKVGDATQLQITVDGLAGTEILEGVEWIADTNGLRYRSVGNNTVESSGLVNVEVHCQDTGDIGNVPNTAEFTIAHTIPGISSAAAYYSTILDGVDPETQESYRRRILQEIRTVGGGSNGVDHRAWAEEVDGVDRAYPYAGAPEGETTEPGDRVVYIKATTSYSPDSVPDQALLDAVRDNINTDPSTGLSRVVLGSTDDSLYTEPVDRVGMYFRVNDLTVPEGVSENDVRGAIDLALGEYCDSLFPFVTGVDVNVEQNDTVTNPSASKVVQEILRGYQSTSTGILFGISPGTYISTYVLGQSDSIYLVDVEYITT